MSYCSKTWNPKSTERFPGVSKVYDDIVKSPGDKRSYRGLVLTNRLKVLLVSDPSTDTSAASFNVSVGNMSDPEEVPGLAHFLEHMLFMGTKKYPKVNEFQTFVKTNGGGYNASTHFDCTLFHFNIMPEYLEKALDRMSQFFIAPLFAESSVNKEINAVNSEFEQKFAMDHRRFMVLKKSTMNQAHPYHKFPTGNKETLETNLKAKGIDIRKELLKFYQKWYSSNIMSIIVLGKESLDELQKMVVSLFSDIEDRSVTAPTWPESQFPLLPIKKRTYWLPVNDTRELCIEFPLPDVTIHYKTDPLKYVYALLSNAGPGSLISSLKKKGWCESLTIDIIGARGFRFMTLCLELTEDGLNHTDDIVEKVFQYISLIRTEGPQKRFWEERRDLLDLKFKFRDVINPITFVKNYVQDYPMEDVLSAKNLLTEWKPEIIKSILDYLTPEKVNIWIAAKSFAHKCRETEKWYETKYFQADIEDSRIQQWMAAKPTPEFYLPLPNEFIPTKLDLVSLYDDADNLPKILKDTPLMRVWFKKDSEYLLPKAYLRFNFISPLVNSDPLSVNISSLWITLLNDNLHESLYAASEAGLMWSLYKMTNGINVSIDGFDDKQDLLLEKIVNEIVNFKSNPQRFEVIKEKYMRNLKNTESETPTTLASNQQSICLTEKQWTNTQMMETVKDITHKQLDDFVARFLRNVHVEALMYGNLTMERAIQMADNVEELLPKDANPLFSEQLLLNRTIELEKGASYLRVINNSVNISSCAHIYYECGITGTRSTAMLDLLDNIVHEPLFNVLRTKEQLGYSVGSGSIKPTGCQGLLLYVHGGKHPAYLEKRIENFLKGFEEGLENMTEDQFQKQKEALISKKLVEPKSMSGRVNNYWAEIASQEYNFKRPKIEVQVLKTITKDEFMEFYKRNISAKSGERRKLSIHVVSTAEGGAGNNPDFFEKTEEEKPIKITDITEFKSQRKLYALPKPYMDIPRKGLQCTV